PRDRFPENRQPVIVAVLTTTEEFPYPFAIAPPQAVPPPALPMAWLPLKVQPLTVRVPPLRLLMPPPSVSVLAPPRDTLLDSTSLLSIRVLPTFKIPPPSVPEAKPFSIVRPAMVTATGFWFWLTSKTRLAWLPLMASMPAPGPSMSRLWVIASSPLV